MNQSWFGIALLGVGILVFAGCSTADETIAAQREPLLCKSVDVCDDGNRCTDDLCIANLCVNEPLLNCQLGGEGGGGAGSDDSGSMSGHGGSANAQGGSANGQSGSGNHAGSANQAGANAGGSSNGGAGQETAAGANGTLSAAGAVADDSGGKPDDKSQAGAGGAAGHEPGEGAAAAATQWTMQGGGCALGHTSPGFPFALGALFVFGLLSRARRARAGARS